MVLGLHHCTSSDNIEETTSAMHAIKS